MGKEQGSQGGQEKGKKPPWVIEKGSEKHKEIVNQIRKSSEERERNLFGKINDALRGLKGENETGEDNQ